MTGPQEDLRAAYLAWLKRRAAALAVPLVSILIGELAIVHGRPSPAPPLGLHSMVLAVAVGAVAFGRALKQRPRRTGMQGARDAFAVIRSTSDGLLIAALTPSACGALLVPITRSIVDLYLFTALTLFGVVTLMPRVSDWERWHDELISGRSGR